MHALKFQRFSECISSFAILDIYFLRAAVFIFQASALAISTKLQRLQHQIAAPHQGVTTLQSRRSNCMNMKNSRNRQIVWTILSRCAYLPRCLQPRFSSEVFTAYRLPNPRNRISNPPPNRLSHKRTWQEPPCWLQEAI